MPPSSTRACVGQSARHIVMLALLLTATAFGGARAQQATRLRAAVDASSRAVAKPQTTSLRPMPAAADSGEHRNPVMRGAQIGALVGVGAGLLYTIVLNSVRSCTEKNNLVCPEDEHDNRTFTVPIYGGVIGGLLAAAIGAYRR